MLQSLAESPNQQLGLIQKFGKSGTSTVPIDFGCLGSWRKPMVTIFLAMRSTAQIHL
jgi:hypothetical protein